MGHISYIVNIYVYIYIILLLSHFFLWFNIISRWILDGKKLILWSCNQSDYLRSPATNLFFAWYLKLAMKWCIYPLVNQQFDPENHQFIVVSHSSSKPDDCQGRTVNLLEGKVNFDGTHGTMGTDHRDMTGILEM